MKPELFNDLNEITEEVKQLPESLMAKAPSFTSGNLVVFDSNGNGYDSGKNVNDVASGQFLPLTGGTLTGPITIDRNSNTPGIWLRTEVNETTGFRGISAIYKNASSTVDYGLLLRDSNALKDPNNNITSLQINNNTTLDKKLRLLDKVDGVEIAYRIYGEHNKPTAADVGALPINEVGGVHNIKTYTALSQIGCTIENTILEIAAALPGKSKIIYNTITTSEIYPATYSVVIIENFSSYFEAKCSNVVDGSYWTGSGDINSSRWSGWKKKFSDSDVIPVANGGTGQTTIPNIIKSYFPTKYTTLATNYNLAVTGAGWDSNGYISAKDLRNVMGLGNTISALPIANGGTGATTATAALTNLGALPLSGGTMTGSILKAGSSASWISGRNNALVKLNTYNAYTAITSMKTTNGSWDMGVYTGDKMYFTYCPDTNYNAGTNSGYTQIRLEPTGVLYGAAWNDYAEYRIAESIEPGRVVIEDASGEMKLATERLQPGAEIISDTFGFAIGETENCRTPIAATGRVLAYTYEDRNSYPLGAAVCSGPNGTVSLMTREEIREYPERIIGTVSEIPKYETWGQNNVKVNNRIWIRIK